LYSRGQLLYSTFLGGGVNAPDFGEGIAVTPNGQAYVTGFAQSTHFPTTQNAFQRVLGGSGDIFLTKFSSSGDLIYSSYLGGPGPEFSPSVVVDRDTNAYISGGVEATSSATGSTFPTTPGAFQQKFRGGSTDSFVVKVVPLCALSTVNRSVTICSPSSGSTLQSPVRIIAGTTDVIPVKLTQVYLDGKKIYEARLSAINVGLPIASGTHRLTVQAFDTANVIFKKSITIAVKP
jgi:Big-like domain-containing protein